MSQSKAPHSRRQPEVSRPSEPTISSSNTNKERKPKKPSVSPSREKSRKIIASARPPSNTQLPNADRTTRDVIGLRQPSASSIQSTLDLRRTSGRDVYSLDSDLGNPYAYTASQGGDGSASLSGDNVHAPSAFPVARTAYQNTAPPGVQVSARSCLFKEAQRGVI